MLLRKLKVNRLNGTIMEDIEWSREYLLAVTGSVSERDNAH